jgi:hypothetical protein
MASNADLSWWGDPAWWALGISTLSFVVAGWSVWITRHTATLTKLQLDALEEERASRHEADIRVVMRKQGKSYREPPRVFRRPVCLSQAAMADSSSW